MSLLLSIETSTDVCSVAVHDEGKLLAEQIIAEPQAHASKLAPLIQTILKNLKLEPTQLSAIAVTAGPGSYTGLRIGTSTAKGLCLALEIPLISVPTLNVMAFRAHPESSGISSLCPMIDARRMEVYCQIFDESLEPKTTVEAQIIDENSFAELLAAGPMLFFGNGAEKCKTVLSGINVKFLDGIFPTASALGSLAHKKLENKQFEDLGSFKPYYLKEFVPKVAQQFF